MGRIEKLKREAIKEATSKILENEPPGTRGSGLTWDDVEKGEGKVKPRFKVPEVIVQDVMLENILRWLKGRYSNYLAKYVGGKYDPNLHFSKEILYDKKEQQEIKDAIGRIIRDTFDEYSYKR